MEVERQGREPREVQEGARGGERKGRMGRAKGAMRKATQRGKEALSEARDVAMGAAQSMRDQGREKYHQARGDRGPPAIAAGDVPLTEEDKLRKKKPRPFMSWMKDRKGRSRKSPMVPVRVEPHLRHPEGPPAGPVQQAGPSRAQEGRREEYESGESGEEEETTTPEEMEVAVIEEVAPATVFPTRTGGPLQPTAGAVQPGLQQPRATGVMSASETRRMQEEYRPGRRVIQETGIFKAAGTSKTPEHEPYTGAVGPLSEGVRGMGAEEDPGSRDYYEMVERVGRSPGERGGM